MMDGAAQAWMQNLPPRSINSWEQLKIAFIQNFQGTCKKLSTIEDLERCVQKKGESARHWIKRVSEIINSSQGLPPISVLMAMERNCTFNPLSWKLGHMKDNLNQGIPITIGEIMAGANKHAATDKTKDQEEVGKGQGGSGQNHNQNQSQNQNHGGTKRPYDNSDLVANTSSGNRRRDNNSQGYQAHRLSAQEVLQSPCPRHAKNGRCVHSLEQCVDMQ